MFQKTIPKNYRKRLLRLIESIYFQRMRSTGDIQFFVCRSRIARDWVKGEWSDHYNTQDKVTITSSDYNIIEKISEYYSKPLKTCRMNVFISSEII